MSPQSEQAEAQAVQLLSGAGAEHALATVARAAQLHLPGATGSSLRPGSWRLVQLNHRPGAGVTGSFAVTVDRRPSELAPHRGLHPGEVMVCLSTAAMPPDAQVSSIQWEGVPFAAWLWPQDPWLPGLRAAAAPVPQLVGNTPLRSVPVGYRPTRRAVFRVLTDLSAPPLPSTHQTHQPHHDDDRPIAYIKVVRPQRETDLVSRHNILAAAHVPVPHVLSATGDGAVALAHVKGPTAAQVFTTGVGRFPDPEHLVALLDRFPAQVMTLPVRLSWSDRVLDHARSACNALPNERGRVQSLAQKVHAVCGSSGDIELVPTHGDFHPGNVILGPHPVDPALGPITGLLDLDNVGPGQLSDDLACYLAHLWALTAGRWSPTDLNTARIHTEVFEELVEPTELRARTAGVLLSLIAVTARRGGQRAARQCLELAETILQGRGPSL
ncbi:phosphotransferase [Kocuria sp.]|uniref:phosphotransferase n=1 Tax=Kocuria sp. TaxID=1871328 RepID=UPI0026DFC7A4|nr:phosphotransferase [Kocuria sp.]MDO5619055.1 phosphotransferase [Kocuria sp.]